MSQWIWTLDDVKNTPSIRAGFTKEQETNYRREGCKIISEVGSQLKLKGNPTIATASIYFHRFYMIKPFQEFPREITALGCLFLAGKVEETPKKCKDLCTNAVSRFPDIYAKCHNLSEDIMGMERVLLHILKFDLQVDLPYDALLEYGEMFPAISKENMKEVTQIAWTFINDSYYTTLCVTTDPQMIAIALLHLAFTVKSITPVEPGGDPCWWSKDISNWPSESVDKACHLVLDFYAATKNSPVLQNGRLCR
ncbi:unnamed protein product [Caenorhabditis angaria]|uniref:Cyclin-like domain-containing protein n=1 Tax=Caenorhabditis angaria TaxID=860376 RepID=A0A9P1IZ32_9PELO|nr:unnamed protein product [Caenorhabditis angaria]